MTLIVSTNVLLKERPGGAVALAPRRRRLSTIMRSHNAHGRAIPLVFRRGHDWRRATRAEVDAAVRLKGQYSSTLVGPHDTVVLLHPVRGRNGAMIGIALASIALIALAPYAASAIVGGATSGFAFFAVKTGLVLGVAALAYAANRAVAAKKKAAPSFENLSGGGNVARRGDRRPLLYGRSWSTPPLAQKDYFFYVPGRTVVHKRMVLGLGKFDVESIRIGESLFWTKTGGIQAPFNTPVLGGQEAAVEILYEQPSAIMAGDYISSDSVGGQELPRPSGNPGWTPWVRLTPHGVVARSVLLNVQWPGGVGYTSRSGTQKPAPAGYEFQAQRLNPTTGNPTGPILDFASHGFTALVSSPVPYTHVTDLPEFAEWQIRGRNKWNENPAINLQNAVTWDGMTAIIPSSKTRAKTTEIVIRVPGIKGLPISGLSDVQVLATRIVPVWNGSAWVEQPTKKAVWALADLIRGEHGLNQPSSVDAAKFLAYANRPDLQGFDEFNGALPSVSSVWEAANEILAPLRAELTKVGTVFTFARDESASTPGGRHVISRRQIVRDSSAQNYDYTTTESNFGDVIVGFLRDGDPKRPDEVRQTAFAQTRTPKRYDINGVTSAEHAMMLANWLGARSMYRGDRRKVTTEWDGRLISPGAHLAADLWFIGGKTVVGIEDRSGNTLTLDAKPALAAGATHALIRNRAGREWGILRATYDGEYGLALNADDVASFTSSTGLSLANVIAKETQDPTTVMLGDLVEMQKSYVATSAIPSSENRIDIEMVRDDPRVWQVLDEPIVVPPAPASDAPTVIARPVIPAVHARCERIETGIEIVWGIGTARGAASYSAEMSFDAGVTWETLQEQLANQSGRKAIQQSDDPVIFRARAWGDTGLAGDWLQTTFTTVAPKIDGGRTDIVGIMIEALEEQLQEILVGTGPGSVAEARAAGVAAFAHADDAFDRANTAFDNANAAFARADDAFAHGTGLADDIRLALSENPFDRARSGEPIRAFRDDLESAIAVLSDLQHKVYDTQGRLVEIGVQMGPEGVYQIAGQARLDGRINTVSVTLDALAAKVTLLAETVVDGDFDGLIEQVAQISITLDAINEALSLKVNTTEFGPQVARIDQLSIDLDGVADEIALKAAQTTVDALSTTLSNAILQIQAQGAILARTSAATAITDAEMRDLTIDAILARLSEVEGDLGARLSTASLSLSSRTDDQGRSIAEMARSLLAVSQQSAAWYDEVVRSIASGDSSVTALISTLGAQVNNPISGLPATLARLITEEGARATADSALTTSFNGLAAQVNHSTTGLPAALARILAEETARASADTALANRTTALEGAVNNSTTGLAATLARLVAEEIARADADAAEATARLAISAQLNHGTSGLPATLARLINEESARATADTALSNRTGALESTVNHVSTGLPATLSRLIAEETARASADSALTTSLNGLSAQVNHVSSGLPATLARLVVEETARATADTALASRASALESTVNNPTNGVAATYAGLTSFMSTQATTNSAVSTSLTNLVSRMGTAEAGITAANVARATGDTALATSLTQTQAALDGVSAFGRRSTAVSTGPDGTTVILEDRVSRTTGGTMVSGGEYLMILQDGSVRKVVDVDKFFIGRMVGGVLQYASALEFDSSTGAISVPNLVVRENLIAPEAVASFGDYVQPQTVTLMAAGNPGQTYSGIVPGFGKTITVANEAWLDIQAQVDLQINGEFGYPVKATVYLDINGELTQLAVGDLAHSARVPGTLQSIRKVVPAGVYNINLVWTYVQTGGFNTNLSAAIYGKPDARASRMSYVAIKKGAALVN